VSAGQSLSRPRGRIGHRGPGRNPDRRRTRRASSPSRSIGTGRREVQAVWCHSARLDAGGELVCAGCWLALHQRPSKELPFFLNVLTTHRGGEGVLARQALRHTLDPPRDGWDFHQPGGTSQRLTCFHRHGKEVFSGEPPPSRLLEPFRSTLEEHERRLDIVDTWWISDPAWSNKLPPSTDPRFA